MGKWLACDWPLPERVRAYYSERRGGVSQAPYDSFNLGDHVGDDPLSVAANRQQLCEGLAIDRILWLNQVHGHTCIEYENWQPGIAADAITARKPGQVCAVLTADCLPILLADEDGTQVAAVHGGWRSLAEDILARTVQQFDSNKLSAYLAPAISQAAFEVGAEVRETFMSISQEYGKAFKEGASGKFMADLYHIARTQLAMFGVNEVYGGERCTFSESDCFFSYRRDGVTGRQVSLLWIDFSE